MSLRFGQGWAKSLSFHTGQTPVLKYNRQLMMAILWDRLPIAKIVNAKVITLDEAPAGYAAFDSGVPNQGDADLVTHFSSGFIGTEVHTAIDLQSTHAFLAGEHQVNDAETVAKRLVAHIALTL